VLRPIDAATVELAPGVSAHHSPGHTPGQYVVRVFPNDETSYLLGDVVHHPLQLNDQRISFLSEAEPERALRVREELLTALQGRNVSIGMAHFPGLDFQQITTANGVRGAPPGSGSHRRARSGSGGYGSSTGGRGRHRT
jgi:glyoxylase-like metal-dependent hydrolase (beta-lactamase superfamily II)